jgi:hypothetical protein
MPATVISYYAFRFLPVKIRIMESIKGTPINTIHGTNETVSRNVLWYKGRAESCLPNNIKNNVIDG